MNVKELLCEWISYYIKKDIDQNDNADTNTDDKQSEKVSE